MRATERAGSGQPTQCVHRSCRETRAVAGNCAFSGAGRGSPSREAAPAQASARLWAFFGSPQRLTWPALDLRRGLRRVLNHSELHKTKNKETHNAHTKPD